MNIWGIELLPSDMIALCSLVVALTALSATFYQSYLSRKHNLVSVRPHLTFLWSSCSSGFRCKVKNCGLGPAYIQEVRYFASNRLVACDSAEEFYDLLDSVGIAVRVLDTHFSRISNNSALLPNEEITLFYVGAEDSGPALKGYLDEHLSKIKVQLKYNCAYGHSLKTNRSSFEPMTKKP